MGIFKNMGGNIPGANFLGGNFPGGVWLVRIFRGGVGGTVSKKDSNTGIFVWILRYF